ncbi:unnamed protein product [Protopolystoma xenopodis]|uniref:Uncharacterized protein n=1 Tax=Protopolystoma xenopodis TaxID=117903 RepID=A0A448WXM5_9PLAT|nr:unnamed protein product [Protopolystoma xenopodis]
MTRPDPTRAESTGLTWAQRGPPAHLPDRLPGRLVGPRVEWTTGMDEWGRAEDRDGEGCQVSRELVKQWLCCSLVCACVRECTG